MTTRYVLAALIDPRRRWWRRLESVLDQIDAPVHPVVALEPVGLLALIDTGRRFSAVVLDAQRAGVDEAFVRRLGSTGLPVLVVASAADRGWVEAGGATVVDPPAGDSLWRAIAAKCVPVPDHAARLDRPIGPGRPVDLRLATVIGSGGSGRSTTALALARGLSPRYRVALLDLCRWSDLHWFLPGHDDDPGLIEAVRSLGHGDRCATSARSLLRPTTFGFDLLRGVSRPDHLDLVGGVRLSATLDALGDAYEIVVAASDTDGGPTADTAVTRARVVVVVGNGQGPAHRRIDHIVSQTAPDDPRVMVATWGDHPGGTVELGEAGADPGHPPAALVASITEAVEIRLRHRQHSPADRGAPVTPGEVGQWPEDDRSG